MNELKNLAKQQTIITLLYAALDTKHNNAAVLQRPLHSK